MTTESAPQERSQPSGPAAAAMISAGLGILVIGFLTTGAEVSEALKGFLAFYTPAGALTGKTGIGVVVWLVSWLILGNRWRDQQYNLDRAFVITMVLSALGLLLTFPPIFGALE